MNDDIKVIIANLLQYSLSAVDYKFDKLTPTEKTLIGNQENLNEIKKFIHETLPRGSVRGFLTTLRYKIKKIFS
ncbi:MAG: hypothetical protein ACD_33C00002G0022 [uncultured bacterium]|nr:MAG: hypothetical protein ACD_33C00002G0022 [uncultured bacterium]